MVSISANTMPLKQRTELKSLFKNKTHLSASHFAELIDSLLNKRDDKFHGVWKPGQTYKKGDVVYYDGSLWEMKAENEICAKEEHKPDKSDDWKSPLKEIVDKNQQELQTLRKEFTEYKQQMELRLKQLLGYITLLTLGAAIAFVWFFFGSIFQLFAVTFAG